ncbi:unnamed protein product [Gongylonema pulchrum]|uniref:Zf-Tim10_DDP domain-containing protein n=1 Tax=Gongylonema pulchrum TaxID=637853 RepID=A0A183DNC6_9BILA|nr:unnamed protein product [Gongylonema pulchrum]
MGELRLQMVRCASLCYNDVADDRTTEECVRRCGRMEQVDKAIRRELSKLSVFRTVWSGAWQSVGVKNLKKVMLILKEAF